jgi:hypothetical protein
MVLEPIDDEYNYQYNFHKVDNPPLPGMSGKHMREYYP